MKKLAGLQNILLFITDKCNLKCSYCYVCQGTTVMPFEIAKKAIDNIDDFTVVDFFGGEALLEIELLENIVDYAKAEKRELVFQLFSNGTRYDDRVKALMDKGVNIGVSCDGLSALDRTHNEDLAKLILQNAKAMKKDKPYLGVKVAITPDNVKHLVDNVKFLVNEGLNFVSHFILREDVWKEEDIKTFEQQVNELMKWYLPRVREIKLDYFDGFLLENKRKTGCWAGCDGVAINFNGDLYPCQRFLTNGSPFIIGNVETGITNAAFKKYDIKNFVGCKSCEQYSKCNNICIASQWENGAMFKPIDCVCTLTNILYKAVQILEPEREFLTKRMKKVNGG